MADRKANTPEEKALVDRIVSIISVIVALGSFLGAFIAIDARYALAEDFNVYKRTTQSQLRQYQQDNRVGVLAIRRSFLEDKVFELEAKRGTRGYTAVEEALHSRYVDQLHQLDEQQRKLSAGTVGAD